MNQKEIVKGEFHNENNSNKPLINLNEYKKNVSSQYGENGIIKKIFDVIGTSNKVCVEFGGYDLEILSNIFPLWRHEGWHGVVIEGDRKRYKKIQKDFDTLNINKDLSLHILNRWVEAEGADSLDEILSAVDMPKEFDLCSIDVDSIEYHIWEGLNKFIPRVVIIEFNPTVPPHISLVGKKSGNYIGSGVYDFMQLGNEKGYDLVACTTTNAIFVRKEESDPFKNKNDLNALFDPSCLTYVINSYDGGVFFTRKPIYGEAIIRKNRFRIENSEEYYFLSCWRNIGKTIRYFLRYFTF